MLGPAGLSAQEVGARLASPSERDGKQFKDWQLRCGRPAPDAAEVCEMFQQQTNDEQQTVLAVVIGKVPEIARPGMLMILPLGVLLPPGVKLTIDGATAVEEEYSMCDTQGCRVEVLVTDELVARMKAGREARLTFQYAGSGRREQFGVPLSLYGFTAAYAEVMK